MRTIEFRGRHVETGEWVYGSLLDGDIIVSGPVDVDEEYIGLSEWCSVDPKTIGQYIGLRDKNGKEIYEGDIIKITFDTNFAEKPFYFGKVVYGAESGYPAFDLDPWIDCEMNALGWLKSESDESVVSYEVIGNFYENPDILANQT
ncbi:YopX family protein [Paenibacillus abyssi]|uniref:YopX protein domain-containing protein n=1 Tax=Paenibacillus abyssi TaxID=1340531 RepID=A0A917CJS4_9BACL|nr:YopX family protein [Paenibacillus abyssi]GGF87978.1 hypothetical protein GCM10010916_01610 [Paenibacillus abyssi]